MKKIAKHIPNILTIFRFILIPFIVLNLANDKFIAAFVIFTISGLTDILDGFNDTFCSFAIFIDTVSKLSKLTLWQINAHK